MTRRTGHVTSHRPLLKASSPAWLGTSAPIATPQTSARRVALLGIPAGPNLSRNLFRSRLADLGWVEDKSLVLNMRFTHGDGARLAPLTAELLAP